MASYFQNFPKKLINFAVEGESDFKVIVTDILRRVKISNTDIKANGAFETYTIKDGETPEIVSMKYYGSQEYFWLILMVNDLFYGLESFPKSYYDLDTYISSTYGETGKYEIHHYEDSNGNEVNAIVSGNNLKIFNPVTLAWDSVPKASFTEVTNFEYEDIRNENKRNIYLLHPEFLKDVVREVYKLLAE